MFERVRTWHFFRFNLNQRFLAASDHWNTGIPTNEMKWLSILWGRTPPAPSACEWWCMIRVFSLCLPCEVFAPTGMCFRWFTPGTPLRYKPWLLDSSSHYTQTTSTLPHGPRRTDAYRLTTDLSAQTDERVQDRRLLRSCDRENRNPVVAGIRLPWPLGNPSIILDVSTFIKR